MAATRKRHTHRLTNEAGTKFQNDARNAFQNEGTRRRHRYCLTHCECLVTPAAGECPEWQRGRTVNPLAYAFVGSSPTSPTITSRRTENPDDRLCVCRQLPWSPCGCSSMVEQQPSKLMTRVRFPSPAPCVSFRFLQPRDTPMNEKSTFADRVAGL
jgi:hypothetical protein